ncbi:MAG: type II toxin-antitoxin system YafQ family toxin [Prevotellaceae bacterium]|nr:type II toxin-antitoxin system YafQ family toxin [Prevotellaceae bacterium]
MKELHYSTKAKKDLKKFRNIPYKMQAFYEVIGLLLRGEEVPMRYLPHKLLGKYRDCMECHIGSDFLLIWVDRYDKSIYIVRIGSHSELF